MFTDPRHSRHKTQAARMKKSDMSGMCIFCPEGLKHIHHLPIEKKTRHWVLTDNAFPYEGAELHKLCIPRAHLTDASQISKDAWAELHIIFAYIKKTYGPPGYSIFMRCGNTAHTGATITHLHLQIIAGNSSADTPEQSREALTTKIGYKKKKRTSR